MVIKKIIQNFLYYLIENEMKLNIKIINMKFFGVN